MSASTQRKDFSLDGLFGVKGLDVVITGAGTGIGLYMAKGFAVNGAITHIVGRRQAKLEEAKEVILQLNPNVVNHLTSAGIVVPISPYQS
ncbi:hypothetical protein V865_004439 [Kwoniella europaea PYCC6329]|uniref:Uncharacterized protein n=1 Tax=Kwoniella europaea PYCC6329 TaxID=1423913 RepID=A0AAX4KJK9_9TREE